MNGSATDCWLVLHADDFGMNPTVNEGILRAFRDGLLTSTSLLANAPNAQEACAAWPTLIDDLRAESMPSAARRRALRDPLHAFDLGIHLNLTQGVPLSAGYPAELLNERGQFPGVGRVFQQLRTPGSRFREPVRAELQLQIKTMRDKGIQPGHLNGHQYIELIPGVSELIPDLMARYSIRVVRVARETNLLRTVLAKGRVGAFAVALVKRHYANRFQRHEAATLPAPARFFGTSHAGLVTQVTLREFLATASPAGCTEIGLHPATAATNPAISTTGPATTATGTATTATGPATGATGQATGPAGPAIVATGRATSPEEWLDPLANTRPAELQWLCDPTTDALIQSHSLRLGRLNDIAPA